MQVSKELDTHRERERETEREVNVWTWSVMSASSGGGGGSVLDGATRLSKQKVGVKKRKVMIRCVCCCWRDCVFLHTHFHPLCVHAGAF